MLNNRLTLLLALILSACAASPAAEPVATLELPVLAPDRATLQSEIYDQVWLHIEEEYVYADQADLPTLRATYAERIREPLPDDAFNALLNEMLAELPPGSALVEPRSERLSGLDVSLAGIGVYPSFRAEPSPRLIMLAVVPDSPAAEAGLERHESIIAVEGDPIEAGINAAELIRGPLGSEVTLTVERADGSQREVVVPRSPITTPALLGTALKDDTVGYLIFPPAPYSGMATDIRNAVAQLGAETAGNLRGLILDFRVTLRGGLWNNDTTQWMWGFFLPNEFVGTFYTNTEENSVPNLVVGRELSELPLAVLVGPDTRGWPEMFAAGLAERPNTTVIGLPTTGDIENLETFSLLNGSTLVLAVQSYRTVGGTEVGLVGVTPEIVIEQDWHQVTVDDDPVIDAAVDAIDEMQ